MFMVDLKNVVELYATNQMTYCQSFYWQILFYWLNNKPGSILNASNPCVAAKYFKFARNSVHFFFRTSTGTTQMCIYWVIVDDHSVKLAIKSTTKWLVDKNAFVSFEIITFQSFSLICPKIQRIRAHKHIKNSGRRWKTEVCAIMTLFLLKRHHFSLILTNFTMAFPLKWLYA